MEPNRSENAGRCAGRSQKVRSTAPQATAWCVVGAVDRALYELLNVDVYEVLGVDVDAYDTAPCRLAVVRALRWPLCVVLGQHPGGGGGRGAEPASRPTMATSSRVHA